MTIEIALAISILSVAFSIFFGLKNNKRSADSEVADRTAGMTRVEVKIDMLTSQFAEFSKEIKSEIKSTKDELALLTARVVEVEQSAKQAHKRLDRVDSILDSKDK